MASALSLGRVPMRPVLVARMDWILLVLLQSSPTVVMSFVAAFSNLAITLLVVTFFTILVTSIMVFFGSLFGIGRRRMTGTPVAVPVSALQLLRLRRDAIGPALAGLRDDQLLLQPNDMTIGAHVSGIIRQRIVVSAGLLVSLMKGDGDGPAIIAHERAHIRQWDLFMVGFIGIGIVDVILNPLITLYYEFIRGPIVPMSFLYLLLATTHAFLIIGILSWLSRNREYYADAAAIRVLGNVEQYKALLSRRSISEGSDFHLFHPSFARRIREIETGFRAIRRQTLWRLYLLFYLSMGFVVPYLPWIKADRVEFDQGYAIIAFLMLMLETMRSRILGGVRDTPVVAAPFSSPPPIKVPAIPTVASDPVDPEPPRGAGSVLGTIVKTILVTVAVVCAMAYLAPDHPVSAATIVGGFLYTLLLKLRRRRRP